MNVSLTCLLVACVMPGLLAAVAKIGGARAGRRFDNNHPRAWLADLTGWPARANAAQQNSWEALMIFIASLVAAHHAQLPQSMLDFWSVWFIVVRILYVLLYIADRANLRSLAWAVAFAGPVRLFIAAIA